jgi:hypothetical protein
VPDCDFLLKRGNTVDRQTENKGLAVFFPHPAHLKVLDDTDFSENFQCSAKAFYDRG